ncbi:hypothetical protein G3I59_06290 [Amycolatopsis rubida]|uniref:Uncharacterized protein n=1 Tax=Amycolatopsis rubida TaxID=112413 RepID=A0ABX0BJ26_9PSEU|nr:MULTISPECIES: hypothetical protein [Amycolatopsis]MYW90239.1 hypothetical protein [Amycolatopsis rubida]NEC55216.1 hypothetical protein [Amycolatopsis rubida]OAP20106.1 hypothetical protein A4R44_09167 [Amycolatopsis sp. M39]
MAERMLVVLDEAAKSDALHAWRQVAPEHRIVHCPPDRAPVLLEAATDAKPLADVVAGGRLVPVALRLAERYPDAVRPGLIRRATAAGPASGSPRRAPASPRSARPGRGRGASARPGRGSADRTAGRRGRGGDARPASPSPPPGLVT